MAEFKEVCKQWRRMCDEIQRCSTEKNECCTMYCALGNTPVAVNCQTQPTKIWKMPKLLL